MTLLEEIQSAAIDQNCDLGTILRKCKLLAARLGSQPLGNWLIYESNGYPSEIVVPDYRVWTLEVKGHFVGPYGSETRNANIPFAFIPEDARKFYQNYEYRHSIANLESCLEQSKTGGSSWQVAAPGLALFLGEKVIQSQSCISAWAEIKPGYAIEVLNSVRNRILDFVLAVWKNEPQAGELSEKANHQIEQSTITQIFNTTIHGGSANLVGTAIDSSIAFSIINNDFSSLEHALKEKGITTEDISELKTAVESDPKPESDNKLGPKVSKWISKMMGKAADGTWKIGIGTAGSFLAQAIAKYYGL